MAAPSRSVVIAVLLATFFGTSGWSSTQESKPATEAQNPQNAAFRLDFVVEELGTGRAINARTYTLMARVHTGSSIRVGDRVPITLSAGQSPKFEYMDVGFDLDCAVGELRENLLDITATLQISSFANSQEEQGNRNFLPPVTRRIMANVTAAVPIGRQTRIASLEDASNKQRYELLVTVTRVR